MGLGPLEMVHATLTCPTCGRVAKVVLLVGLQGIIKTHDYLCCDDLSVMLLEICNENSEQSGSEEGVD